MALWESQTRGRGSYQEIPSCKDGVPPKGEQGSCWVLAEAGKLGPSVDPFTGLRYEVSQNTKADKS